MDSSSLWRLVLIGILVLIAIRVVGYVLNILSGLVSTALTIAIIVGIVWLLFNLLSRRNSY